MGNSVAIIGAGVAGLSAGCYARMNGMDACIFELHDKPGGLCTAWQREGYTFDNCIEWLIGSSEASSFHGGLPPSAMSGRNVIRKLCEQTDKVFKVSEP